MGAAFNKGIGRVERALGCDCDDVCGYATVRTLRVRDRRLGLLHTFLQLAIFAYVVVTVVLVQQQYLRMGGISGSVRIDLGDPLPQYRYPTFLGLPPYCAGTTRANNNDTRYIFPSAGVYQYVGPGGPSPVSPQYTCSYLDERYLLGDGAEAASVFLPTRITTHNQTLNLGPTCASAALPSPGCSYADTTATTVYVPDVDMFTLSVYHSFTTTTGITRGSYDMRGYLVDGSGNVIDICQLYTLWGGAAVCPPGIGMGKQQRDVLPIRAFLLAAGIPLLDDPVAPSGPLSNVTRRFGGTVLMVDIQYTNTAGRTLSTVRGTGSYDSSEVQYAYVVRSATDLEATDTVTVTTNNIMPAASRIVYERGGLRIMFTQSGAVGSFDLQVGWACGMPVALAPSYHSSRPSIADPACEPHCGAGPVAHRHRCGGHCCNQVFAPSRHLQPVQGE